MAFIRHHNALTRAVLSGYVRRMEPETNDILAAIDRSLRMKRGTLRAWMIDNYQALQQRLEIRKPDWDALAKVFADGGLLNARGEAPTAEATRKTWFRGQG
jgi:hypothetical protein